MANGILQAAGGDAAPATYCPPSLTERLIAEKKNLTERLEEVEHVLSKLEQNPETAEILNAVAKLGHMPY